jgi:hypothetical protein
MTGSALHASISPRGHSDPETGVSELIGAILMISIVVGAVAIIGVLLISQTSPQKIPNVNFMTGTDDSGNMYLLHNGGDTLVRGCFTVVVDNRIRNDFTIPDGDPNVWSFGKNLVIPPDASSLPSSSPHTVSITYNATGGAVVLRSANSSIVMTSSTLVSNPDYIASYPPVVSVPIMMQNVTGASIDFYREGGTTIPYGPGYYIQFNITKKNSSLWYGPSGLTPGQSFALNEGSRITIIPYPDLTSTFAQPGISAFGIGDQIWELAAQNATVIIVNQSGNQDVTSLNSGKPIAINHTWITGYKDFQSTLGLTTSGTYFTELVTNHYTSSSLSQNFTSQRINTTSSLVIVIDKVQPTSAGVFVLQYNYNTGRTYFAGNSTRVTVDSIQYYP